MNADGSEVSEPLSCGSVNAEVEACNEAGVTGEGSTHRDHRRDRRRAKTAARTVIQAQRARAERGLNTSELESCKQMTSDQIGNAIRAFRMANCPACEAVKSNLEDPFCGDCMELLPEGLHDDIVFMENFIEKFHPAMEILSRGIRKDVDASNAPPVPE